LRVGISDLAAVASLDIAAEGTPELPVALVELPDHIPGADVIGAVARAAAESSPVLVGVSKGAPRSEWQPLIDALALTLVETAEDVPLACVAVEDVEAESARLLSHVGASPIASATLHRLLRATAELSVADGLVVESLAYSTLLAGPEFARWLARRERHEPKPEEQPPVLVERTDSTLSITLNRPTRHNAYSARMRDALIEGLDLAIFDTSVSRVLLQGVGPSFCSGGDLDEFGTTPDPATAHIIRVERSVASRLHQLRDRLVTHVHGACIGAGTEFAAFCGTVVAAEDAYFQLPEVAMGLLPGAGGTVSVCRRIGRWRTAYLALTGCRIDVERALAWNLVDRRADV
jgi:enoyl-CoA hydratase/carnithine racemase